MFPITLVGYRVSPETLKQYRTIKNLPKFNDGLLVEDLESKIGIPLALVSVESDEDDDWARMPDYYLCCFADYSTRPYDVAELLAIPILPAFHQLPQVIAVERNVRWLFAPMATIDRSAKSELNEHAFHIGGGYGV